MTAGLVGQLAEKLLQRLGLSLPRVCLSPSTVLCEEECREKKKRKEATGKQVREETRGMAWIDATIITHLWLTLLHCPLGTQLNEDMPPPYGGEKR